MFREGERDLLPIFPPHHLKVVPQGLVILCLAQQLGHGPSDNPQVLGWTYDSGIICRTIQFHKR